MHTNNLFTSSIIMLKCPWDLNRAELDYKHVCIIYKPKSWKTFYDAQIPNAWTQNIIYYICLVFTYKGFFFLHLSEPQTLNYWYKQLYVTEFHNVLWKALLYWTSSCVIMTWCGRIIFTQQTTWMRNCKMQNVMKKVKSYEVEYHLNVDLLIWIHFKEVLQLKHPHSAKFGKFCHNKIFYQ